MNRNDWVFVGIRLLGLWILVQAVLSTPTALMVAQAELQSRSGISRNGASLLLSSGLTMLVGVILLLGASRLSTWLIAKDSRQMGTTP